MEEEDLACLQFCVVNQQLITKLKPILFGASKSNSNYKYNTNTIENDEKIQNDKKTQHDEKIFGQYKITKLRYNTKLILHKFWVRNPTPLMEFLKFYYY